MTTKSCCFMTFIHDKNINIDNKTVEIDKKRLEAQVAQTHVAREGCNVIYITYVTRAGVALQATVENIRDFVWEIYH